MSHTPKGSFILGSDIVDVEGSSPYTLDFTEGSRFRFAAIGGPITINAGALPNHVRDVVLILENDATLPRTVTLGTGFVPSAATVVGTVSKRAIVTFVRAGSELIETARLLVLVI